MTRIRFRKLIALPTLLYVASLGAAGLGFLKDSALVALTDADRKLQLETALRVLDGPGMQESSEWKNPESGSSGRVEAQGKFTAEDGSYCRKLSLQTRANGVESQFSFPVCKDPHGQWFIASGKKIPGL